MHSCPQKDKVAGRFCTFLSFFVSVVSSASCPSPDLLIILPSASILSSPPAPIILACMDPVATGGCLCGKVRYRLSSPPLYQLVCVCTQCQTLAGGFAQGSWIVPKDSVTLVQGGDNLRDFTMPQSEKGVVRRFCMDCGTHVTASSAGHPVTAIHVGTLDPPASFSPQIVIWAKSKRPYHSFPPGVPEFPEYPPPPPSSPS